MDYKDFKYPIFESSPKAKAFIESYEDSKGLGGQQRGQKDLPWRELKIGQSFIIPYDRMTKARLKNIAAQKPPMIGKTFKVIGHDEQKIYEVARIK